LGVTTPKVDNFLKVPMKFR